MTLTPKQQRFVEEYLVDLNATQAAVRAGTPPRRRGSRASDC
jgi:phage terminase small subunit